MQVKVAGRGLELNDLIFHMVEKLGQGIHQRNIVLLFGMHKNLIGHRHLPRSMIV